MKADFLTNPSAWTRSANTTTDCVKYASAIERPRNPDGVVVWLGVAIIAGLLAAVSLGVI
jgi:hypothetical protein